MIIYNQAQVLTYEDIVYASGLGHTKNSSNPIRSSSKLDVLPDSVQQTDRF